jgi:hypothetical protein
MQRLPGFAGFFGLVIGACLGPNVTLGADSAVLCVVVNSFGVRDSVTEPVVGWGSVGGAVLTRPHGRGSNQDLGSPAGRIAPLGLPSAWKSGCTARLLRSIGVRLASATLASFPFTKPRHLAVWFPSRLQHLR